MVFTAAMITANKMISTERIIVPIIFLALLIVSSSYKNSLPAAKLKTMKGFAASIYHKNNTKEKKNAGLDVTCILRDIFRCFL